jgi:hypothetical protein
VDSEGRTLWIVDSTEPDFAKIALGIVAGVASKTVHKSGVVKPYHGKMGDLPDYKSGSGVFMRGLLYAYSQPNNPVKKFVDDDAYHIREVLLASANDACESSPGDLFDNLNVLATLTTAKALGIIQV